MVIAFRKELNAKAILRVDVLVALVAIDTQFEVVKLHVASFSLYR